MAKGVEAVAVQKSYRERLGHVPYVDPGIDCSKDERITAQEFKDECDINKIVAKYDKTGVLTHVNALQASFGDFSGVPTYQEALTLVTEAQAAFMELPAEIRKRFDNDPAQLLAFVGDEKNRDEAIRIGLIEDKTKATPSVNDGQQPVAASQPQDGPSANTVSGGKP